MNGFTCPLCHRKVWATFKCSRCGEHVCAHCINTILGDKEKLCLKCEREVKMAIWDNPKALDKLESRREKQKKKIGRLTYDCFNARCQEDRVICRQGKCLARGNMSLLSVLSGRTASACKSCLSFDG